MDFKEKRISDQQKTIESLSHEISALREESARRETELNEQIKRLNQEIANLSETLRTIAGGRFAPSSESSSARQIEGQLNLDFFNEAEYRSADITPEPTAADIEIDEVKKASYSAISFLSWRKSFPMIHRKSVKPSVLNSLSLFWMPFGVGLINKIHLPDPIFTKQ